MGTLKYLRNVRREAEGYGVIFGEPTHKGPHLRVELIFGTARKQFTLPVSGGQQQEKLFRSDLRRWLRDLGHDPGNFT